MGGLGSGQVSPNAPRTPFAAIAAVARRAANDGARLTWPSDRWARDPVGFARDVLQTELCDAQVDLVESIRDHRNTTCRSGHKCGKSVAVAVAALWFYCSFTDARVLMTAVKAGQIDLVLWREVRRLYRRAEKYSKFPIDGELCDLARSGLRHDDGRHIFGLTARDPEGLAGLSGANMLVLCDEASGIKDAFFEVLGTSLAGSGGTVRKCYISNPTRTAGEFYRSHTSQSASFNCLHFSSEDTPNARGTGVVPGLAGPEWIAERKLEYGVDSAAYRIRVKGEFVADLDGKIISLNLLAEAEARWDETPDEGDLQLGCDPAGDGVIGDETAIAVRLGKKIVTVLAWRGLTEEEIVYQLLGLLGLYKPRSRGIPRIAIDVGGGIGTRVFAKLRAQLDISGQAHTVELLAVRSDRAMVGSAEYVTARDALWGQTRTFLKDVKGALPEDVKLAQELNAPSFTEVKGRYVATSKKELRSMLSRSPDRADAVCLSIWQFASVDLTATADDMRARRGRATAHEHAEAAIDAYEMDGVGGGDDSDAPDGVYG